MGRDLRVEYKGAIYHVIQRGNNKELIFKNDYDKSFLINYIDKIRQEIGFKIFAYVLMSNHYHFIIQTLDEPLHIIMHKINNKYSKYFNSCFGHSGHVFEGRYKAIPVQDESYLFTLIRYIHQNPVRANICAQVQDYYWSSDWIYRYNKRDGVIDIDTVLDSLSEDRIDAIERYIKLIEIKETEDFDNVKSVGDRAYQLLYSPRRKVEQRKRLDEILIDITKDNDTYKMIKSGSRQRGLIQYKLAYIKSALEMEYSMKEIGENISMSGMAIKGILYR